MGSSPAASPLQGALLGEPPPTPSAAHPPGPQQSGASSRALVSHQCAGALPARAPVPAGRVHLGVLVLVSAGRSVSGSLARPAPPGQRRLPRAGNRLALPTHAAPIQARALPTRRKTRRQAEHESATGTPPACPGTLGDPWGPSWPEPPLSLTSRPEALWGLTGAVHGRPACAASWSPSSDGAPRTDESPRTPALTLPGSLSLPAR